MLDIMRNRAGPFYSFPSSGLLGQVQVSLLRLSVNTSPIRGRTSFTSLLYPAITPPIPHHR